MKQIKIIIPGNPIPKARHKRRRLKDGRIMDYDPQHLLKISVGRFLKEAIEKNDGYKNSIKSSVLMKFHCRLGIYCPISNSTTQPQKNLKLWGVIPHTQKPDCSNVLKFYEDVGNKILYSDDCMITRLQVEKESSENPRIELTLTAIEKTTNSDQDEILKVFSPSDIEIILEAFNQLPGCCADIDFWQEMVTTEEKWNYITKFLSVIADRFGDKFQKVSKKAPGYWQKAGETTCLNRPMK